MVLDVMLIKLSRRPYTGSIRVLFKDVMFLTLQVSSLLGLCGRMKAALLSGPLHESAGCLKSKQLVRTTK